MLEVEAKIKLDSIDEIKAILKEKKARFISKSIQKDTYFNSNQRDFAKTDEALRIRDNEGKYELTYKGPKVKGTDAKAREEFNVDINSAENLEEIFIRLGFFKSSNVFKTREEYSYKNTTIALDVLEGLGHFIEIEVVSDDKEEAIELIDSVKSDLGIKGENIRESYLEMLLNKK
ncbi:class IV adenylate cyclase [Methanomicrobium antiquum]|uniref:Class IV adenylate cyclase n=1 Tax=Methanomicrobium antiquum TaxID=487686 RepID=A0AAF0FQ63_9EURY|nr:class IV adenylate cyclase [Methanomicrobium antiquum]MDD3976707.1 class IV adenylate cyclase [Methanomicrobium sp.]WFN35941.1 class IV adenylate cyclase [Methanomicrobium antiquum]